LSRNYTDQELISSIVEGNKDAFNMLYNRHWQGMYKYAFFILRDKDACQDIVQDVFVWLWEHRAGLKMHSPVSYLRAAVKYKIANYIRTGKIRESFFEEAAQFNYSTLTPDIVESAELKELNNVIQSTVAQLPVKCQEIFRLSREENISNKEIARQRGISAKTVENQITIALHRIRSNVEQHFLTIFLLLFFC
jgi:RNA polymerase sigma-70 factor (family 1)